MHQSRAMFSNPRSFIVSIQCFVPNALGRPPHPEFPKWFLERYRFDFLQNMVEPTEHTAHIFERGKAVLSSLEHGQPIICIPLASLNTVTTSNRNNRYTELTGWFWIVHGRKGVDVVTERRHRRHVVLKSVTCFKKTSVTYQLRRLQLHHHSCVTFSCGINICIISVAQLTAALIRGSPLTAIPLTVIPLTVPPLTVTPLTVPYLIDILRQYLAALHLSLHALLFLLRSFYFQNSSCS